MFAGAWVVLKGSATLVGRDGTKPWWNSTGNPWMAQGGSGDVLAGFLAGLLARPDVSADAGKAVRFGVFEHGAAADRLLSRGVGWTTEDLAEEVGRLPAPAGWGEA
jgi:NAD(P)H-hydrate epimerase